MMMMMMTTTTTIIPWLWSVSELYRPSNRCLSAKLVPTFVDRGGVVWSVRWIPTAIISVSRLAQKLIQVQYWICVGYSLLLSRFVLDTAYCYQDLCWIQLTAIKICVGHSLLLSRFVLDTAYCYQDFVHKTS
jgi:hypothetical protein